jgi:hypothetical protein
VKAKWRLSRLSDIEPAQLPNFEPKVKPGVAGAKKGPRGCGG